MKYSGRFFLPLFLLTLLYLPAGVGAESRNFRCIEGNAETIVYTVRGKMRMISRRMGEQLLRKQLYRAKAASRLGRVRRTLTQLRFLRSECGSQLTQTALESRSCSTPPSLDQVFPSSSIRLTGSTQSLGLTGAGFSSQNRMMLIQQRNGEAPESVDFSLTELTQSYAGTLRLGVEAIAGDTIEFTLLVDNGRTFCRSNPISVEFFSGQECAPCAWPLSDTPECRGGKIAYSDDSWLDPDGLPAFPGVAAILRAAGHSHRLKHASFGSNFISYNPALHAEVQVGAAALSLYGVSSEILYDAYIDRSRTTEHLASVMASATPCDPVFVLVAGPFEIISDALQLVRGWNSAALPFITLVSHSEWNNTFGNVTKVMVAQEFPEVRQVQIRDGNQTGFNQYGAANGFLFLNPSPLLSPIRYMGERAFTYSQWVFRDWSDATLAFTAVTGDDNATLANIQALLAPLRGDTCDHFERIFAERECGTVPSTYCEFLGQLLSQARIPELDGGIRVQSRQLAEENSLAPEWRVFADSTVPGGVGLEWRGAASLSQPGLGRISQQVYITTPGEYAVTISMRKVLPNQNAGNVAWFSIPGGDFVLSNGAKIPATERRVVLRGLASGGGVNVVGRGELEHENTYHELRVSFSQPGFYTLQIDGSEPFTQIFGATLSQSGYEQPVSGTSVCSNR